MYIRVCTCMYVCMYVYIYVTYMALSDSVISTCMCLYLEALSGYLDLLCLNKFYNWLNHLQTNTHTVLVTVLSSSVEVHT